MTLSSSIPASRSMILHGGNTPTLGSIGTADIMKEPPAAVLWKPPLLIWISFLTAEMGSSWFYLNHSKMLINPNYMHTLVACRWPELHLIHIILNLKNPLTSMKYNIFNCNSYFFTVSRVLITNKANMKLK